MKKPIIFAGALVFAAIVIIPLVHSQQPPTDTEFTNPQPVTIQGYSGSAEEPYITPDGQYLIFDSRTDPEKIASKIYYAKKVSDTTFAFMGEVKGVNTNNADADLVSIDDTDNFYFFSSRSYHQDFQTIYRGVWNNGTVTGVGPIIGLSDKEFGMVNVDPEISADGRALYFSDADFGDFKGDLKNMEVKVAVKNIDGSFTKLDNSDELRKRTANNHLSGFIGPVFTSHDGLEGFFTRDNPADNSAHIYIIKRNSISEPFGMPELVGAADGFVEGQFLSRDGGHLYYHKALGNGSFGIYMLTRQAVSIPTAP